MASYNMWLSNYLDLLSKLSFATNVFYMITFSWGCDRFVVAGKLDAKWLNYYRMSIEEFSRLKLVRNWTPLFSQVGSNGFLSEP